MSPFKGKERGPSGEEIERDFSHPGLHRISKKPLVYVDVSTKGEGSLWFLDKGLTIVSEEEGETESLVPQVPLERSEKREVILYVSGEERVRIGWEPSKEEKLREIEDLVRREISKSQELRYAPLGKRIANRYNRLYPSRVKLLKNKELSRGRKTLLGLIMVAEAVGAGSIGLGEYISVLPLRGLKDLVTGYWAKEKARLTTQYLSELEAERQSSEDLHS